MLTIIEDHFEHPIWVSRQRRGWLAGREVREVGRAITVANVFQVALRRAALRGAIAFVDLRRSDIGGVLRFIIIDDEVAFVVVRLADQPGKNVVWLGWIGDAAA